MTIFLYPPKRVLWLLLFPSLFLASCQTELLRWQEKEIQELRRETARLQQETEELQLARLKMQQKRQDCNRAFRQFERAQGLDDLGRAIALYRQGLNLCPSDEVAHFELGRLLARTGRSQEAEEELEAALSLNPDFDSAKRALQALPLRGK